MVKKVDKKANKIDVKCTFDTVQPKKAVTMKHEAVDYHERFNSPKEFVTTVS